MPKYDKLVRDNIIEIIESEGKEVKYRVVDGEEYLDYLEDKLREEVEEFIEQPSNEELTDILTVLYTFNQKLDDNIIDLNFETTYGVKLRKKGGFEKGIVLEEVVENGME